MSRSPIEHPDELLPWYINGTLEGEEERGVEEHLESCPACRDAVRELEALRLATRDALATDTPSPGEAGLARLLAAVDVEAAEKEEATTPTEASPDAPLKFRPPHRDQPARPRARRRRSARFWAPLAVAALLVLAVGVTLRAPSTDPATDPAPAVLRDASTSALRSATPADRALPRERFELRWEVDPAWASARFAVQVTTIDLRPIAEARDLAETRYQVPAEALAELATGTRLLWRVEATRSDGARQSSETFYVTLD